MSNKSMYTHYEHGYPFTAESRKIRNLQRIFQVTYYINLIVCNLLYLR